MTKMEIATYLGMNNVLLKESLKSDDEAADMTRKILQAVQEAQLIMYELARADIIADISGIEEVNNG